MNIKKRKVCTWKLRNRERYLAAKRMWHEKNRDKVNAMARASYRKRVELRPEEMKQQRRRYYANNPQNQLSATARWKKKNPWLWLLYGARARCRNKNIPCYGRYGGRGIKCLLTKSEIKFLWDRDNAAAMECPSLDRVDNDGHYCIENCRVMEMKENARLGARLRWARARTDS